MKQQVIFDDWSYRHENSLKNRKRDYIICAIPLSMLAVISLVGIFLSVYSLIAFMLAIGINLAILFEYLKIKHNHLIITPQNISVTNRFNVTRMYEVDYKACTLEIKPSLKRGGGLWLIFFDKNGKLLLKYEDMLNTPTMYGGKMLPWGEAIRSLQIPIIDKSNLFDRW